MASPQLRALVKEAVAKARVTEHPPALEVFPTLQRFASQRYAPFCPRSIYFGFSERNLRRKTRMSRTMYHDLGVMVFAGATDEQVQRIGNILKSITKLPGGSGRLAGAAQAEHKRRRIYRISSEGLPLEEDWVEQEGSIDLGGLVHVSRTICSELSKEIEAVASEAGMEAPKLKMGGISATKTEKSRGLIHPTVNGPRRLPIDAHVFIDVHANSIIQMTVELYTVGTCQYLGTTGFTGWLYCDIDGKEVQLKSLHLEKLLEAMPSPVQWPGEEFETVAAQVLALEKEIWTQKSERLVENEKWEKNNRLVAELKKREKAAAKNGEANTAGWRKGKGKGEEKGPRRRVGAVAGVAANPKNDLVVRLITPKKGTGKAKSKTRADETARAESEVETTSEVAAGDGPRESQIERQDNLFNMNKGT